MTNQSWLLVTNISAEPKLASRWDLIKTVHCVGKKAKALAKLYQNDLNEGLDMMGCLKSGRDYLNVCSIPWSQAREYVTDKIRRAIKNAPEYIPTMICSKEER